MDSQEVCLAKTFPPVIQDCKESKSFVHIVTDNVNNVAVLGNSRSQCQKMIEFVREAQCGVPKDGLDELLIDQIPGSQQSLLRCSLPCLASGPITAATAIFDEGLEKRLINTREPQADSRLCSAAHHFFVLQITLSDGIGMR